MFTLLYFTLKPPYEVGVLTPQPLLLEG